MGVFRDAFKFGIHPLIELTEHARGRSYCATLRQFRVERIQGYTHGFASFRLLKLLKRKGA